MSDQEQSTVAPRRVVVAEDESLIRMDIVEILRDNGYDVVGEAGDGETAVALATELRPDLVVMDIRMPVMDGIEAAKRLSENHIAPVVLLTAFSQKELVEQASEAGALAYVVKPFTPNDLLPAIEIALSRYQQILTLEAEVADLVERFETRKLVDRAKGLLNERMGLTEPEAFRWIQKASMDRRTTMHAVAQAIIEQLVDAQEGRREGSAARRRVAGGRRDQRSRSMFVMRTVERRRPSSSRMTISCVASVRPSESAVHVPVTQPSVDRARVRRIDLDADRVPAGPGVDRGRDRAEALPEHDVRARRGAAR